MRDETKELYPDNWPEISEACIGRAKRICKDCGRSDRTSSIVLTTHHKDYDPSNNVEKNLVCLCQGCHSRRQSRDLAQARILRKIAAPGRKGQLCFPGMKPRIPKRLVRVIEGKALATFPGKPGHARRGTER